MEIAKKIASIEYKEYYWRMVHDVVPWHGTKLFCDKKMHDCENQRVLIQYGKEAKDMKRGTCKKCFRVLPIGYDGDTCSKCLLEKMNSMVKRPEIDDDGLMVESGAHIQKKMMLNGLEYWHLYDKENKLRFFAPSDESERMIKYWNGNRYLW